MSGAAAHNCARKRASTDAQYRAASSACATSPCGHRCKGTSNAVRGFRRSHGFHQKCVSALLLA